MNNFATRLLMSMSVVSICFSPFTFAEELTVLPEQEMVTLENHDAVELPEQEAAPLPEFVYTEENTTEVELSDEVMGDFMEDIHYFADAPYLYRLHNNAYHHLSAISDTGSIIQLHDASKWDAHPSQRHLVLFWENNDDIFIKPRSSCFSFYRYVMHNITQNQAIEVSLRTPPLPMGAYTFRITNIDTHQRLVYLSDGTVWQVSRYDRNFYQWQIGHRLMIGVNNNWKSAEMPHVLINVDMYKEPYSEADFKGVVVHY